MLQALARFGAVRVSTALCAGAAVFVTGAAHGRMAYWTSFAGDSTRRLPVTSRSAPLLMRVAASRW